jgi:hypothetical protein
VQEDSQAGVKFVIFYVVFIGIGRWKEACEVTGARCCYWDVEGEKKDRQYIYILVYIDIYSYIYI